MENSDSREKLKERAKKHTFNVGIYYEDEIAECVKNSIVYSPMFLYSSGKKEENKTILFKGTTTKALIHLRKSHGDEKKICLLNFADYLSPGGGFIVGSNAQEENLCHDSFLYNVLASFKDYYDWNAENINHGLYTNRAVYSPDIRFFYGADTVIADVLTCAAPNWGACSRNGISKEENFATIKDRIIFLKSILAEHMPDIAVLGAWGCGAFKQDASVVASLLLNDDYRIAKDYVMYAVPDDSNYGIFLDVFGKLNKLPF